MAENSNNVSELVEVIKLQVESQNKIINQLENKTSVSKQFNNKNEEKEIDLLRLALSILKSWWAILLFTALGAGATLLFLLFTYVPSYTATAKMYINNTSLSIGSTKVSISSSDLSASQSLVDTYCAVLKTYLVLDQVGEDLETNYGYTDYDYETLIKKIKTGSVDSTEIFYISVTDNDPEKAINITNAIIDDLPSQISSVIEGSSARVVDRATKAVVDDNNFLKYTAIGAAVGFAVSCAGAAVFNYFLNDEYDNPEWLKETFSTIPSFGEIPDLNSNNHNGQYYSKYQSGYVVHDEHHKSNASDKNSKSLKEKTSNEEGK